MNEEKMKINDINTWLGLFVIIVLVMVMFGGSYFICKRNLSKDDQKKDPMFEEKNNQEKQTPTPTSSPLATSKPDSTSNNAVQNTFSFTGTIFSSMNQNNFRYIEIEKFCVQENSMCPKKAVIADWNALIPLFDLLKRPVYTPITPSGMGLSDRTIKIYFDENGIRTQMSVQLESHTVIKSVSGTMKEIYQIETNHELSSQLNNLVDQLYQQY